MRPPPGGSRAADNDADPDDTTSDRLPDQGDAITDQGRPIVALAVPR